MSFQVWEFRHGEAQNLFVACENIMDVLLNQEFTILTAYLNHLVFTAVQLNQVSGKGAKTLAFVKSEESKHEIHH